MSNDLQEIEFSVSVTVVGCDVQLCQSAQKSMDCWSGTLGKRIKFIRESHVIRQLITVGTLLLCTNM